MKTSCGKCAIIIPLKTRASPKEESVDETLVVEEVLASSCEMNASLNHSFPTLFSLPAFHILAGWLLGFFIYGIHVKLLALTSVEYRIA